MAVAAEKALNVEFSFDLRDAPLGQRRLPRTPNTAQEAAIEVETHDLLTDHSHEEETKLVTACCLSEVFTIDQRVPSHYNHFVQRIVKDVKLGQQVRLFLQFHHPTGQFDHEKLIGRH